MTPSNSTLKFSPLKVSAPSKVILHGEHAVVYGKTAVAAALDLRTRMTIRPHEEQVVVKFPDLGLSRSWSLEELRKLFSHKPEKIKEDEVDMVYLDRIHDFLGVESSNLRMASVICFLYLYSIILEELLVPMEIQVVSEIPLGAGLGSSAALSVCLAGGLIGVLHQARGLDKNIFTCLESGDTRGHVCRMAFLSEKILHGTPSGIDNSVSSFGGVIRFKQGEITTMAARSPLNVLLVNTNVERNTKNLVSGVRSRLESHPFIINPILESIEAVSQEFVKLLDKDKIDMSELETLVDYNQGLLKTIGVSHPSLENVINIFRKHGLHGKLTGAGGGGFAFTFLPQNISEDAVSQVSKELETGGYTVVRTKVGGPGVSVQLEDDETQ